MLSVSFEFRRTPTHTLIQYATTHTGSRNRSCCESKEWGQDRGKIGPSWQYTDNLFISSWYACADVSISRWAVLDFIYSSLKEKHGTGQIQAFILAEPSPYAERLEALGVIWEERGGLEQMAGVPLGERRLPRWTLGALDHLEQKAMSSTP